MAMKMSLWEVMKEAQGGGGESLLSILTYSILPIAKVFTMCFMGFLMASKYVNVLPANGRKLLNGLVFSLLLPCLIFSDLGRAVTLQNLLRWWFLPVNVIMATISGSLIGLIVASIIRPPYPYFKFTIIHIGIGNTGNVPLVLIAALCRDQSNPFGDTAMCSQQGNAYISFGQWVGAIILYTYVFQMLAPPPGETFDSTDEAKLPTRTFVDSLVPEHDKLPTKLPISTTVPEQVPEQVPLLALEEAQKIGPLSSKRVKIMDQLHLLVQKLKLKQIFQPPITAAILAIFIGCVPFLKNFILTDDAPLFFFTDSCLILGEAMIPCILLALGGNLVEGPGPGSKRLGFRTIVAIIFARLVLVPPVGLGIYFLGDKLGFYPEGDKMFRFILLLQYAMPTSVLSGVIANLRGCGKESAAILFWVHLCAIISMTGWITLYLSMLF
ncbi:protein PIN-LIKES 6-like [Ananas comosus]|uniref:Protein PIN-LIKES 6-like n=1 Tax=Ananas comosus TaxID=4615 RepID=A0A6P5HDP5_ANACO|nr:protein PIN-LIKES 6-like [Ananas comosus]